MYADGLSACRRLISGTEKLCGVCYIQIQSSLAKRGKHFVKNMPPNPDQRWHDPDALLWRLVAEGVIPPPQKYRGKLKWSRAVIGLQ